MKPRLYFAFEQKASARSVIRTSTPPMLIGRVCEPLSSSY
jgi:hypothetical protein